MKRLAALAGLVLLAAACSSESAPQSTTEFRDQLTEDLLSEIDSAGLEEELDDLARAALSSCMEQVEPESTEETDDFVDCYATSLCASDLVAPVWDGDEATCVEEARASFDLGG